MKKVLGTLYSVLLVVMVAGCANKVNKEAQVEDSRPSVRLSQVSERAVPQTYEYVGTIEPEFKNNIAPSTPLRIEKILVEIGDFVKKNQKVALMDTSNFRQIELQLENEKREFERIDELYKVGGVSKSEWETAKMSLEVRESAYLNLLENTNLLSPIEGVISARNYDNGDMYSSAKPLLTVEKITPVKLLVNISESLYAKVSKGQKVKIRLDVYPEEVFEGRVSIVYPTIAPDTRTFTVEIKIDNYNKKIRPGMFARAEFNYGNLNRVVVPDLSIIKQVGAGDRYVYVYDGGKVFFRKVELGRRLGNEYELISGVKNNSQVVVAGQSKLADGVEVEVLQ